MAADDKHNNFRSSLLKFCATQVAAMITATTLAADATNFDFDAVSQMEDLPKRDLVGIANFSYTNHDRDYEIQVSIGVSTFDDENLFRHHKALSTLEKVLRPAMTIPVVDGDSGDELGWFVLKAPVALLPVLKTDGHSLQMFLLTMATSEIS